MVQDDELHFDAESVRRQLGRVLSSSVFSAAKRSRMFLRYIVERTLLGSPPKEFEIAAEVLGRGTDYDPDKDATVRVEASRLRYRLREYYDTVGKNDPVFINIPKGAYRAVFVSGGAVPTISASVTEHFSAPPLLTASNTPSAHPQTLGSAVLESSATEAQSQTGYVRRGAWLLSLRGHPTWWIGMVVAGILVLVTPWASRQRQQTAGPTHSLAVLPLQNLSGDVREEYFVDGITDALITELARTPNLRVISRTSVMQEKGSKKPLRQIASALDVDAVIEGSVARSGDRVRITARLIDARDDRHLWAKSYEEQMSDILTLQDKVVREIAFQTQTALQPFAERVHPRHIQPAAYDAYLRGLYSLHRREVDKSAMYFRRAVALDASYAAAHAGLAEALMTRLVSGSASFDEHAEAFAAAKHAIELDPESGEAYSALGLLDSYWEKDWAAAGRDLKRSIALSPNYSLGEMRYAIFLDAMARPEEAVSHMRRALQLDPRSFLMNRHLGATLYLARHYEEALEYLQRAEAMEPARFGYVEEWKTRSYEMALRTDDAERADLRDLSIIFPDAQLAALHRAYQKGGWKGYHRARIDLIGKQPRNACDLYDMGESYMRLGDIDRSFSWLARGIEGRCYWADLLPVDPLLDRLRGDPRFLTLLQMERLGKSGKSAVS